MKLFALILFVLMYVLMIARPTTSPAINPVKKFAFTQSL